MNDNYIRAISPYPEKEAYYLSVRTVLSFYFYMRYTADISFGRISISGKDYIKK